MPGINAEELAGLLNAKYLQYNVPGFIPYDPISIPHRFSRKQDIEIAGLFAAILAWGQRKTIISKCSELMQMMDNAPYEFIINHQAGDLLRLELFRHRTFNATDLLYFVYFLREHYQRFDSLEYAFVPLQDGVRDVEQALIHFHQYFCSLEFFPERTRKHIASPLRNSTCKRLNMYLRWMVRNDGKGVDFGLWHSLTPAQLICPCDVQVIRVARSLGLITRPSNDWRTALELTQQLRLLDPVDPVKYDFALFGLGIEGFKA